MIFIENRPSKKIFLGVKEFFLLILISKMDVKMRIITKNHASDSKIWSPFKIDFRADWTHESSDSLGVNKEMGRH